MEPSYWHSAVNETPPILTRWTGGSFVPANAPMQKRCNEHFVIDEVYKIEFREERSGNSHRFFFASVSEAWRNLPENIANLYPSPDFLRRKALVMAGYADEIDIPLPDGTPAEMAREIAKTIRKLDSYAVIIPSGDVIKVYRAKSQSVRSMNKADFEASKNAVLSIVADMVGVTPAELASNAAQGDHHPEVARNAPDLTAGEPSRDPPQDTDRPKPMRQRPAMQEAPPSPAVSLTGTAGDTPAVRHSGGSTPDGSSGQPLSPPAPAGAGGSEQKNPGGGDIPPKNYAEYTLYVRAWLSFVTSSKRVKLRYASDQINLWPKFSPPLTEEQETEFDRLVAEAIRIRGE